MLKIADKAYMVKIFKMLANEKRLEILYSILDGEKSVNDIIIDTDLVQSSVSSYLNKMRLLKIVRARQHMNNMYYSLSDINVTNMLRSLGSVYK